MSRRFTLVTVTLTAVVGFLVGAIVAGGVVRSEIAAGTPSPTSRVVTLTERPVRDRADRVDASPLPDRRKPDSDGSPLGITLRDIDRPTADRLELPEAVHGVLIMHVEPVADDRRIAHPGDVVTLHLSVREIDQHQLKTIRVDDR